MTTPDWRAYKPCAACGRYMSADDAHRRCQPCRYAERPPRRASLTERQRRIYNMRRRMPAVYEAIKRLKERAVRI